MQSPVLFYDAAMEKVYLNDKNLFEKAVAALKSGQVVMHPTETCYGLAVDIFDKKALKRLYSLKGRDFDKPVSILVDGLEMAQKYGIFNDKAIELARQYWPGPLSIVVPRKRTLPEFLNPKEEFVSMRCSDNRFCVQLLEEFGGPLTTTSANFSQDPPLYEVDNKFVPLVDLVVDGGKLNETSPSTVVKVEGDELLVLRQGSVSV